MAREIMAKALPSEGKGVKVFYGEFVNEDYVFGYISRLIYGESGIQNIYILENKFWGRMLFINNNLQFTSRDEFIYHESLVHIPMQSAPEGKIKRVLICGGGDYGAAREVLKYPYVEEVIIVDIDPRIPKLIEEYFPELLPENPRDPRLTLITEDAYVLVDKYVKEGQIFDMVIVDSTDPDIGEAEKIQELSHALFGIDFHQKLLKICPSGIVVQQCGTPFTMKNILLGVYKIYQEVYSPKEIYVYRANIPSFGSDNAFIMRCPFRDPHIPKGKEIASTLYYDFSVHTGSFALPKFWKEILYP
ncbi:MAG: spermine synthase [Caldimicrobium sp.]|nr:spermine synthase [Caldimicrobium sp.]MCX7873175.1 spermine synthase [Caldimicrobium sp.]MDW8094246.1 spermine synthase [Caldimicrobium sp.]